MEKKPAIKKYLCHTCFKVHDDLNTAMNCCIQKDIVILFECSDCNKQYLKKELAEGCCSSSN